MENNHENCQAHSGMETKNVVIIWLLGILIILFTTIGGYQMKLLTELKVDIAVGNQKFTEIKDDIKNLERRVEGLERNGP